jgi:hypothetical protein
VPLELSTSNCFKVYLCISVNTDKLSNSWLQKNARHTMLEKVIRPIKISFRSLNKYKSCCPCNFYFYTKQSFKKKQQYSRVVALVTFTFIQSSPPKKIQDSRVVALVTFTFIQSSPSKNTRFKSCCPCNFYFYTKQSFKKIQDSRVFALFTFIQSSVYIC